MRALGVVAERYNLIMNNSDDRKPMYVLAGRIVHGRGIGKKAGMPTANLEVAEGIKLPELGVYAAKIYLDAKEWIGVTNVGLRPTVDNDKDVTIETYIIGFDGDIYEESVCLELYECLRGQQKFEDMSLLVEQLKRDCAQTQKYFGI